MEIRILQENEMPQALRIARGVFDFCLRKSISDGQLVNGFMEYASEENFRRMMQEGALTLWGAFEEGQMVAMSGMQREGHIIMLYVLPVFQRRGCGKELLLAMRKYAESKYQLSYVTLNAMPAWTTSYFAKRKFKQMSMLQGMCPYISMRAKTIHEVSYETKSVSSGWIIGTSLGGLAVCAAVAIGFMICYMNGIR